MINRSLLALASGIALLGAGVEARAANGSGPWITGFYESQNGVEPVSSIPWSKYTHIIHFAAAPDGNGSLILQKLDPAEIAQIIAARPPGKYVLLGIQDYARNPYAFRQSASSGVITNFVNNIAEFVTNNGYDGVDIDWELTPNPSQFSQLVAQLRAALPDKIITADMNNDSASVQAAAASYDSVDQLNVMCYDMDSPANGFSWYNDALFQNGNSAVMTCDWRVSPFLAAGVPISKIGIGAPFYGRRWRGATHALMSGSFPTSTVYYRDLASDPSRWQPQYQFYDSTYRSNYLSIPSMNEFDSYTGVQEIQDLASWVVSKGFGGVMTFSLHYEYLAGEGGDAQYPLSTALYTALTSTARAAPLRMPPLPIRRENSQKLPVYVAIAGPASALLLGLAVFLRRRNK